MSNAKELEIIKAHLKGDKPVTWVFTGDSITQGAKHTRGWRCYQELFSEFVRWELGRKSDVVINTGISGDTAEGILNDFNWRVSRFKPDVVSLMIGTNDCAEGKKGRQKYKETLGKLIDQIRDAGAVPLLHTPSMICIEGSDGIRKDFSNYVQIIGQIASEKETVLVDHCSCWNQQRENRELLMNWLSDSIHPSEYGHRAIANKIFMDLDIYNPDSSTCKLFIP